MVIIYLFIYLFIYDFVYLFIHERQRERERQRQRHRQRKKLPAWEPDMGLHPRTTGLGPRLKGALSR